MMTTIRNKHDDQIDERIYNDMTLGDLNGILFSQTSTVLANQSSSPSQQSIFNSQLTEFDPLNENNFSQQFSQLAMNDSDDDND